MGRAALDAISRLSTDEVAAHLAGPREHVAAFVRDAAEGGSAEAQARFGQMLLDGDGVDKDAEAAFGWFDRAARSGHLEAANMVGRCHDLGWGVPVDKVRAAAWYKRAAERGLVWALYNYATMLTLGQGVVEDKAEALALFRRAADSGNAKAANFVGSFHEDGWVVDRNPIEAARWYAVAAAGGDFRGQFNHARMLMDDDMADALPWLRRAWQGGNVRFRQQMRAWIGCRSLAEQALTNSAIDSQ